MQTREKGVLPTSAVVFLTPDQSTLNRLYYITWAGHYFCDAAYAIDRPEFPDILLCYMVSGSMLFARDEEEVTAEAGDVILLNCSKPHRYHVPDRAEFLYYHCNGQDIHDLADWIINENGSCRFRGRFNRHVQEQMQGQINMLVNGTGTEPVGISQNVYNCLMYLAVRRETAVNMQGTDPIVRSIRYIQKHLSEPLTIEQIATAVNYSPYYFSRRFRVETGNTPAAFIARLRTDKAKSLLRTTDRSIEAIAASVSYDNPGSFTNFFKRMTGMTPRQFREVVI